MTHMYCLVPGPLLTLHETNLHEHIGNQPSILSRLYNPEFVSIARCMLMFGFNHSDLYSTAKHSPHILLLELLSQPSLHFWYRITVHYRNFQRGIISSCLIHRTHDLSATSLISPKLAGHLFQVNPLMRVKVRQEVSTIQPACPSPIGDTISRDTSPCDISFMISAGGDGGKKSFCCSGGSLSL